MNVVMVYCIKGCEFDVVIVCGFEEGNWFVGNYIGFFVCVDCWFFDGFVVVFGWLENFWVEMRLLFVVCLWVCY